MDMWRHSASVASPLASLCLTFKEDFLNCAWYRSTIPIEHGFSMRASLRVIYTASKFSFVSFEIRAEPLSTVRNSSGPMYAILHKRLMFLYINSADWFSKKHAAEKWVLSSTRCITGLLSLNMVSTTKRWFKCNYSVPTIGRNTFGAASASGTYHSPP